MSVKSSIQAVINQLQAVLPDAEKVDAGKTGDPGTRVRAAAQDAKAALQDIRIAVSGARKAK